MTAILAEVSSGAVVQRRTIKMMSPRSLGFEPSPAQRAAIDGVTVR